MRLFGTPQKPRFEIHTTDSGVEFKANSRDDFDYFKEKFEGYYRAGKNEESQFYPILFGLDTTTKASTHTIIFSGERTEINKCLAACGITVTRRKMPESISAERATSPTSISQIRV